VLVEQKSITKLLLVVAEVLAAALVVRHTPVVDMLVLGVTGALTAAAAAKLALAAMVEVEEDWHTAITSP
jgi:phosphohistidine phosphatase SixA